jgi:hypothetical protein
MGWFRSHAVLIGTAKSMDATTLMTVAFLLGAWSAHCRPVIAGMLLTVATIIAGSSVWFPLLRQVM